MRVRHKCPHGEWCVRGEREGDNWNEPRCHKCLANFKVGTDFLRTGKVSDADLERMLDYTGAHLWREVVYEVQRHRAALAKAGAA